VGQISGGAIVKPSNAGGAVRPFWGGGGGEKAGTLSTGSVEVITNEKKEIKVC